MTVCEISIDISKQINEIFVTMKKSNTYFFFVYCKYIHVIVKYKIFILFV